MKMHTCLRKVLAAAKRDTTRDVLDAKRKVQLVEAIRIVEQFVVDNHDFIEVYKR